MAICSNCANTLSAGKSLKLFFFGGYVVCPRCGTALEQDKSKMKSHYLTFGAIASGAAAVAAIQRASWATLFFVLAGVAGIVAVLFHLTVKLKVKEDVQ